jgi:hypothetical protein
MGIASRANHRNKLDFTPELIGYRYKQAFIKAINVLPTAANDFRLRRRKVVSNWHKRHINASVTVSFLQMPQTKYR